MTKCTCFWDVTTGTPELIVIDAECPGHGVPQGWHEEVTC
jgi:hypothetical protein